MLPKTSFEYSSAYPLNTPNGRMVRMIFFPCSLMHILLLYSAATFDIKSSFKFLKLRSAPHWWYSVKSSFYQINTSQFTNSDSSINVPPFIYTINQQMIPYAFKFFFLIIHVKIGENKP